MFTLERKLCEEKNGKLDICKFRSLGKLYPPKQHVVFENLWNGYLVSQVHSWSLHQKCLIPPETSMYLCVLTSKNIQILCSLKWKREVENVFLKYGKEMVGVFRLANTNYVTETKYMFIWFNRFMIFEVWRHQVTAKYYQDPPTTPNPFVYSAPTNIQQEAFGRCVAKSSPINY